MPRKKRTGLSKKLRFEVFKRDRFACQYCGQTPPAVKLHVDHILAVAGGGTNEADNLVTACENCNLGKGARPLDATAEPLMARAADAAERQEQLSAYRALLDEKREQLDRDSWAVVDVLEPGAESFDRRNMTSIRRFIEQLGFYPVLGAAERAYQVVRSSPSGRFRYFCGICWKLVKEGSCAPAT